MERFKAHAGNMDLVRNTLKGIASHDTDEGLLEGVLGERIVQALVLHAGREHGSAISA